MMLTILAQQGKITLPKSKILPAFQLAVCKKFGKPSWRCFTAIKGIVHQQQNMLTLLLTDQAGKALLLVAGRVFGAEIQVKKWLLYFTAIKGK